MPKPVPDDWRWQIRPVDPGPHDSNLRGRLNLAVPHLKHGTMYLYTKVGKGRPDNYSCGLVYDDPTGNQYRLIRCNGYHGVHVNRLEGTRIPALTTHVHYVREAYLRAIQQGRGFKPEGWAIRATFRDLDHALTGLARRANLTYSPSLFEYKVRP